MQPRFVLTILVTHAARLVEELGIREDLHVHP